MHNIYERDICMIRYDGSKTIIITYNYLPTMLVIVMMTMLIGLVKWGLKMDLYYLMISIFRVINITQK